MTGRNLKIKDAILEAALPNVAFDGWTLQTLERAALTAGYPATMAQSVFPSGVKDALIHFSGWADRAMLGRLSKQTAPASIRGKIALAVRTRLDALAPYKEAERLALSYWLRPFRKFEGGRLAWNTADAIWVWAGDTSQDYNRYTKRALLCGVLSSSLLFWLADRSGDHADTSAFIDRRIENVMSVGKIVGRFKSA